jgi:hypothetical protein
MHARRLLRSLPIAPMAVAASLFASACERPPVTPADPGPPRTDGRVRRAAADPHRAPDAGKAPLPLRRPARRCLRPPLGNARLELVRARAGRADLGGGRLVPGGEHRHGGYAVLLPRARRQRGSGRRQRLTRVAPTSPRSSAICRAARRGSLTGRPPRNATIRLTARPTSRAARRTPRFVQRAAPTATARTKGPGAADGTATATVRRCPTWGTRVSQSSSLPPFAKRCGERGPPRPTPGAESFHLSDACPKSPASRTRPPASPASASPLDVRPRASASLEDRAELLVPFDLERRRPPHRARRQLHRRELTHELFARLAERDLEAVAGRAEEIRRATPRPRSPPCAGCTGGRRGARRRSGCGSRRRPSARPSSPRR